jgi:hypothetical protein
MKIPSTYPPGTVRALLDTPAVSPATLAALQERLHASQQPYEPCFFEPAAFALLRAVCQRLLAQNDPPLVEVAYCIDTRLHLQQADGWRYDALPPDAEAYQLSLRGLQQTARARHGQDFVALPGPAQDALLTAFQQGSIEGEAWQGFDAALFFQDMLAEITSLFYAHPLAQEEIGYVGMADLPNWTHIGLNQRDPREPEATD